MDGLSIQMGDAELSVQEVFDRFIREKKGVNLSPDTLQNYQDCFKSFRKILLYLGSLR